MPAMAGTARAGAAKVFIDGQAGTTGLQLARRLAERSDIRLLQIETAARKNPEARQALMAEADLTVLCLPDQAAKEAVALAPGGGARFLDASTAFRTHPDWVYGMPELCAEQRARIASARLVSNPGCYPTGFLAGVAPLVQAGILSTDAQLAVSAISGYTGGGRHLIEAYEKQPQGAWPVRPYALRLAHKHLPEMQRYAGLAAPPHFMPAVGHFPQGMLVATPLAAGQMKRPASAAEIQALLAERYADEPCVKVRPLHDDSATEEGYLDPAALCGKDWLELLVFGTEDRSLLVARLDNLGKGASGAAVQNLNLILGLDEFTGLAMAPEAPAHG